LSTLQFSFCLNIEHADIVHPTVLAICNFFLQSAAAYRLRSAQSNSVFDTGLHIRISGTTGEQFRRDIREAAMNQSWNGPMVRWLS